MKNLRLFLASLALTCCGFFPAVAMADDMDELDVTMDVLDSVAGVDGNVLIMSGPEGFVAEGPDGEDVGEFDDDGDRNNGDENEGELRSESGGESDDERDEAEEDGFDDDGDFLGEDDDEDELTHDEGDFDDGEAIDDDEIEEVEMEDDDEMDDDDV